MTQIEEQCAHIHSYAKQYSCTLHESFLDWIFEDYMAPEWYKMLLKALPEEVQQAEAARLAIAPIEY
ncbi:MAG: hypothetical protein HOG19_13410 [Gammaproteobacteria bacterium]|nr:hypothetical protein [Gammaproteobacteria bacterium]